MKNINKELADKLDYGQKVYLKDSSGNRYKIEVDYDYDPDNPRKWGPVCHIMSVRGNWDIADEGLSFSREDAFDKLKELESNPDIIVKPVYMYEHSGQTIRLTPFRDPWDSGVCGYIYVSKQEVFKCFGDTATEENWKELADDTMKNEIEIYDQYIKGEVYCFDVSERVEVECKNIRTGKTWTEHRWKDVDSCCGFYGNEFDKNGLLEYALENLPDDIEIIEEEE